MASALYASSLTQEPTRWELVTHRHMKGLYTESHNEAVACVSKAVVEGRKGWMPYSADGRCWMAWQSHWHCSM